MNPKVSVIIPTYNTAKYLEQAILSVVKQEFNESCEIIVIDDGSTDATRQVVEKLQQETQIRYFYQNNRGISSARNVGMQNAKGELVAFIDADDIWLSNKLCVQVKYLDEHPDTQMVFSLAQNTYDPTSEGSPFPIIPAHIPLNCIFRRELIKLVGLFDESISLGEFADWYARAVDAKVKVYCVPKLLVKRRIHGNNVGITRKQNQYEYVRILKRKLDRAKSSVTS